MNSVFLKKKNLLPALLNCFINIWITGIYLSVLICQNEINKNDFLTMLYGSTLCFVGGKELDERSATCHNVT
jgi:hypothetical protein